MQRSGAAMVFLGSLSAMQTGPRHGPWMIAGGYSNNDFNDTDVAAGWVTYRFAPGVMGTAGIEYADDSAQEDVGGIAYMSLLF